MDISNTNIKNSIDILNTWQSKTHIDNNNLNINEKNKNFSFSIPKNINEELKRIISNIGLKTNNETLELLKYLIDNNLPLDENTITKFNQLIKLIDINCEKLSEENQKINNLKTSNESNNYDIKSIKDNLYESLLNCKNENNNIKYTFDKDTINKAIFMLKNNIPISKSSINNLNKFTTGQNELENQLNILSKEIENLNNSDFKNKIIEILKNNNLYEDTNIYNEKIHNKLNYNITKNKIIFEEFIEKNNNIYKEFINKKEIIKTNLKNDTLSKESLDNIIKNSSTLNDSEFITIADTLFKKDASLKEKFINNIIFNKKNTSFFNKFKIDISQKENIKIDKQINKLKNALDELQNLVKKNGQSNKSLSNTISATYDSLKFLNLMKTSVLIPIPLVIDNNKLDAQLFVFKDKNKNKNKDATSALIALNTVYLGRIETYVQKSNNNLIIQFRLENSEVEKTLKNNIEILNNLIESHNYSIKGYSFLHIDTPFNILSGKPKIKNNLIDLKISNVDTKA